MLNIGLYYSPKISSADVALNYSDFSKDSWKVENSQPLIINLGKSISASGFTYLPIADAEPVFKYRFSISNDGKSWQEVSTGEFGNIKNNPIAQFVKWQKEMTFRFIKFENLEGAQGGHPQTSIAQIGLLK